MSARVFSSSQTDSGSPLLITVSGIDRSVFSALADARITKVQHFLAWPEVELAKKTDLPVSKIKEISAAVHARFGSKSTTALQERGFHRQGFGTPSTLTSLTGAKEGDIVELVGPPGCGKTQHALTLVASVASSGKGVVVMDTSAAVSTDRIAQILASFGLTQSDIGSAMNRILILPAGTVEQCELGLAALIDDRLTVLAMSVKTFANLTSPSMLVVRDMGLVVIDSGAALISPTLGWRWKDGWSGVACSNTLSNHIRTLADLTQASVVLTNRLVRKESDELRAALGRSWVYLCDTRIYLDVENNAERPGEDDDSICVVQKRLSKSSGLGAPKRALVGPSGVHILG
eukprot:Plantae.Rhodophyta-Palmaria_palmata.ctg250.p1 GENE.Plantae.Rhodophyta-Palmaria_palmata.ctg250~~Plantae.Rhodophyta-Palmaria_palmata.ctg250.p1  ORF type:complete len:346 (+),score=42.30 Plantae.Rhodophyta-Palmaria_palmata.ctg250:193-1230(+)